MQNLEFVHPNCTHRTKSSGEGKGPANPPTSVPYDWDWRKRSVLVLVALVVTFCFGAYLHQGQSCIETHRYASSKGLPVRILKKRSVGSDKESYKCHWEELN